MQRVVRATDGTTGTHPTLRLPSQTMAERYRVVLLPLTEASRLAEDIMAERREGGWQLVSKRVDKYGAEVIVFSRPACHSPSRALGCDHEIGRGQATTGEWRDPRRRLGTHGE